MGKREKLLLNILSGRSDTNVGFDDLRNLLKRLGFDESVRGSHHLFRRPDVEEKINLQREGNHAKPYQVRQVRGVLVKYGLGEEE